MKDFCKNKNLIFIIIFLITLFILIINLPPSKFKEFLKEFVNSVYKFTSIWERILNNLFGNSSYEILLLLLHIKFFMDFEDIKDG